MCDEMNTYQNPPTDRDIIADTLNKLQDEIDDINNTKIPAINTKDNEQDIKISDLETYATQLNDDIQALKNKKYIFIGDSYASGEIGSSWIDDTIDVLGSDICYKAAKSGAGFTINNNTFLQLITTLTGTLSGQTKSEITDIIVGGGYNDAVYSTASKAQKFAAMDTFVTYCNQNYPNAKIHFAFIGWCIISSNFNILSYECNYWIEYATIKPTCDYFNNIEYSLHRADYFDGNYVNPTFHPNALGNKYLAGNIIQCLKTGSCDVHHNIQITVTGSNQSFIGLHCMARVENGITVFDFHKDYNSNDKSPWVAGSSTGKTVTYGSVYASELATLDNDFEGNGAKWSFVPVNVCIHQADGTKIYKTANIGIGARAIFFMLSDGTSVNNVQYIDIMPFRIVYDSMEVC